MGAVISVPAAGQPPAEPASTTAAGAAIAAPAVATGAAAAAIGVAGVLGVGATLTAGAIVAALISFLVQLREMHRQWMLRYLGRYAGSPDDIAEAVAEELRREEEFAQRSSDRLAKAAQAAMSIEDPQARTTALRQALENEKRYAQQRSEAMAVRAIAAVTRARLRRESPLGAFWRLGRAEHHTPGCIVMAGGDHEGAGRFWPWAVLDRVHPPRHHGCTSTLHSFGEAVKNGWMSARDVPDVRAAIRAAGGVMMEGDVAALLAEVELREQLVEAGMDENELALRPWVGVGVERGR